MACATTTASPNNAIDFGGTNAYVTFGDPAALDLAQFTIETWFRRDGTGVTTNTGTGGVLAVPLVTKGRGEAEGTNVDMNYFLGIRGTDNVLMADFEEGVGGPGPLGLNRPIVGATAIQNNVWYHAAAVYDGQTWTLYLNGNLEATLTFTTTVPPRADSIQRAALASALNSTGVAEGFFDGIIDEARVWNSARTQAEIRSTINSQLAAPQAGLVARWGLNEGSGTVVSDTSGNLVTGTVTSSNYQWAPGASFNLNFAPNVPMLVAPANGSTVTTFSPTLSVNVSDPDSSSLAVTFYGRPQVNSGVPFTLTVLPDTQNYTAGLNGGSNATFVAQTQWIVTTRRHRTFPM